MVQSFINARTLISSGRHYKVICKGGTTLLVLVKLIDTLFLLLVTLCWVIQLFIEQYRVWWLIARRLCDCYCPVESFTQKQTSIFSINCYCYGVPHVQKTFEVAIILKLKLHFYNCMLNDISLLPVYLGVSLVYSLCTWGALGF